MSAEQRPGPREPTILTGFIEPLKAPAGEVMRQETVTLNVIEGIQWVYPRKFSPGYGMFPDETPSAPMPPLPEETTWEEYVRSVPEGVVGILEVKQLQGNAVVDGVEVPVNSRRFYTGGIRYIDGQVFSLEDALKQPGAPARVVEGFGILNEGNKAILTRSGTWEPFQEEDSVVLTTEPPQLLHR